MPQKEFEFEFSEHFMFPARKYEFEFYPVD